MSIREIHGNNLLARPKGVPSSVIEQPVDIKTKAKRRR
jgi:hypothetical protein